MAKLLKEADIRSLLTMDDALQAVEDAFRSASRGEAVNVPRHRGALNGATINAMGALSTALDLMAMKIYPIVRQDVTVGSSFQVLAYRMSTGALVGVLEAEYLAMVRTGAASGVASRRLARPGSRVMTLFGAGWQARGQLDAIVRAVPALERVNVIGRSPARVEQFCREMNGHRGLQVIAADDPERAVREADIVTTVTGSATPVFDGRWLQPGVHVNAVGSNFAQKQEIDATAVGRAERIVVDDLVVARTECGDLLAAEAATGLDWSTVAALADVVDGRLPGRTAADQITLFESQGIGLEDLAMASLILARADACGAGIEIPLR
jgi:ornithine cyclodeaminase/alanine dehydrogenase-like protein (mu-crystallin family)